MTSLYFDEAEIGQPRTVGPYLVSSEEIIEFAKKYDPQPFHIDEEAAARSVFAGLTASGAHTFAILISLSLRVIAGPGWDELRLPIPVRPRRASHTMSGSSVRRLDVRVGKGALVTCPPSIQSVGLTSLLPSYASFGNRAVRLWSRWLHLVGADMALDSELRRYGGSPPLAYLNGHPSRFLTFLAQVGFNARYPS
ncbi:MaoC/PaaZ C-terminal domain-containing protein [Bradyrhizobium sp. CB3481]|nr:MaoC/PaaZ C-terminal domain-containing protein [Bradyrhizobium sp. CB3481]WFU16326.1 MaoC/PaaZ C-terminal domain-containing protein [Bradyrhizobium sp. CB3481]